MKRTRKLLVIALAIAIVTVFTSCDMFMPKHYYQAFVDQMKAMDFESMQNHFYSLSDSEQETFKSDIERLGNKGTCLLDYHNEPVVKPTVVRFRTGFMKFNVGLSYYVCQDSSGWKIEKDYKELTEGFVPGVGLGGFKPEKPSDDLLKECKLIFSDPEQSYAYVSYVFDTKAEAIAFYDGYKSALLGQLSKDKIKNYKYYFDVNALPTDSQVEKIDGLYGSNYEGNKDSGNLFCKLNRLHIFGKYVVRVKVY